ncbi:family 2 glycosyl transferase, partial [Photobacterium phosphoreum]
MLKILSIIIPVYNVELYLDECLKSVFEQVTDEVEVIIIND